MTILANRNNVKPVFWFIAGMVVLFCLCWAIVALQSFNTRHFAPTNSMINGSFSFAGFRVLKTPLFMVGFPFPATIILLKSFQADSSTFFGFTVFFITFAFCGPALFAAEIVFLDSFAFFSFTIFFTTFAVYGLTFLCLRILSHRSLIARFTCMTKPIFRGFVPVKLRKGFKLFAFGTWLRYNWFRHNRFSIKRLCFELHKPDICVAFFNYSPQYK